MSKINFKIFSPNESQNSLSTAMDSFLQRQVYLEANCTVILNLKNEVELTFSHMFTDPSSEHLFAAHTFETDPTHHQVHAELRNYLYMWMLVQSVENFESFLKKTISVVETFENSTVGESFRTNKDRIGYLKKTSPEIAQHLTSSRYKEVYETFLLSELIRQITVHSNMTITDRMRPKLNHEAKLFKTYFETTSNGNLMRVHPLNVGSCQQLMIKVSELAYMLFQSLSLKYSLPVIEAIFYLGDSQ